MNEPRTFSCSICGDTSTQICVYCTKDTCPNHICSKCGRCSDCCECEVPLDGPTEQAAPPAEPEVPVSTAPLPAAEPQPLEPPTAEPQP